MSEALFGELALAAADPGPFLQRARRVAESAEAKGVAAPTEAEWRTIAPLLDGEATAARLVRSPRLVSWLVRQAGDPAEKSARRFEREVSARVKAISPGDTTGLDRVVRLYRQREMNRIALRDLSRRSTLRTATRELSHLADALLGAVLAFHDTALGDRGGGPFRGEFCVLAMGKHGAEELNYSSDIDVLFVYSRGDTTRRERAIQLSRLVMRSMSQLTAHGFCFRVDANLRPYGRDGALACGLDEFERYYERAGETWERAALIKARPCAGGIDLGHELIGRLKPFVWRRSLDLAAVESVAAMKRRIDSARASIGVDNVKLGRGGIREVEFFVQAFQLLHGGRQPSLRARGTQEALDALVFAGHIESGDRDALGDAYVFLRDTEHRLQVPVDRQTQALPDGTDRDAWRILGRRMGFDDPRAFRAELARHRDAVHERFGVLLATASEEAPRPVAVDVALARELPDDRREDALLSLGFGAPEEARAELDRLGRQSEGVFGPRSNERHPGVAARLLRAIARSPAPDLALNRLGRLGPPLWEPATLASLLATNAAVTRLVIHLLASSETLANEFRQHPEGLDALVRKDAAVRVRHLDDLRRDVRARLAPLDSIEDRSALLRRVRHEETLRVGLHDLSARLDTEAVSQQLSVVAEVLVGEALAMARDDLVARYGEPPGARVAVLALGSFGAQELRYESDLDLVFVHDAPEGSPGGSRAGISGPEWATRVFQRVLSLLTLPTAEGALYRVDSRLRPSGSQGPLVVSIEAFRRYHVEEHGARGAALWERQALLRARAVAGDASLGEDLTNVLDRATSRPIPDDAAAQIADMRRRLDVPPVPGRIDPKKGPGGSLDVEFAVQYLLLKARRHEASTRVALRWLCQVGAIEPTVRDELLRAWEFLRRVENRLRLAYSRSDVFVPTSGEGLARLARQIGEAGPSAGPRLLAELERTMRTTRTLFETLVR